MSDRKKLMILVDWFYPAEKAGGPIRSCMNFVKLLEKDFKIFILTGDTDFNSQTQLSGIEVNKWTSYSKESLVMYLSSDLRTSQNLKQIINLIQPNLLYLNSMFSVSFSIIPLWLFKNNDLPVDRITLAPRGMLQEGALKLKRVKKLFFIKLATTLKLYKNVHFHATDHQEKKDILYHLKIPESKVSVLANIPTKPSPFKKISKNEGELKILFLARISKKKNLKFLLEVLTYFKLENYSLDFTICGPIEDNDYWEDCKNLINNFSHNIRIAYRGAVPFNEVSSVIQEHHLNVLPTLGENFGHTILETFLAGRPVLISNKTPWINLQDKNIGWSIDLNHSKFHLCIKAALLWTQDEFNQYSINAFRYGQKNIDYAQSKEEYLKFFT